MTKYTRRIGAPIAVITLSLFAACSSDAKRADSAALGADSTLNRDLALANRDTTAQPQLKDVAPTPEATPRPTKPATKPAPKPVSKPTTSTTKSGNTVTTNPAAKPSSGGGAVGMIAEGTTLNAHSSSKICTNTNQVGDHVTATLDGAVSGSNGASIPAGATINLTVTQLKRSENSRDNVVMEFAVNSVTFGGHTYPIEGSITSADVEKIRDEPKSKDIQKVGIGAAAGAIAGKILGKSTKATVIGGAAGAAAGAAAAAATANYQGCINSGGAIVIKLNAPAQVRVS